MDRKEKGMEYFTQGYNCAQSVVLAFEEMLPLDKDTLAKMSCPFGGGMGRLREVCGAVSGMFTVLGFLYGSDDPSDNAAKGKVYERVQELAGQFEARNGSIVCRKLLGLDVEREAPTPQARTSEYYKKRPCKELVGDAIEILEEYIAVQEDSRVL